MAESLAFELEIHTDSGFKSDVEAGPVTQPWLCFGTHHAWCTSQPRLGPGHSSLKAVTGLGYCHTDLAISKGILTYCWLYVHPALRTQSCRTGIRGLFHLLGTESGCGISEATSPSWMPDAKGFPFVKVQQQERNRLKAGLSLFSKTQLTPRARLANLPPPSGEP